MAKGHPLWGCPFVFGRSTSYLGGLLDVDVDRLADDRGAEIVSGGTGIGSAVGLAGPHGDHGSLIQRGRTDTVHDHVVAVGVQLVDGVLGVAWTGRGGARRC